MARKMGDASKVKVAGGDGSNLYYFYTGESSYRDNSIDNIAAFAQEHFDSCKGKSVEDIEANHIFWGTEGASFKGFYNGDTYVLFDDVEKLPEDIKQDALVNCKGYRNLQVQSDDQMKDTLYNLYDEFVAEGAWMGHAYGFENMREYYEPMSAYMKKNGLDSSQVDASYQAVVDEFDSLSNDESRSFLHAEDTKPLEAADRAFMNELAHAAQLTADKLKVDDIRFEPESEPEKKVEDKTVSPSEFDPVHIRRISPKCVREMQRQDGNGVYYRVGISVEKSISENGFANISVSPSVIEKYKGTYMLNYPDNRDVPARVVRNGKSVTEPMVLSDLAESHQKVLESLANRRLPDVPKEAESTNELSFG